MTATLEMKRRFYGGYNVYLIVTCILHALIGIVLYESDIYYNSWQFWSFILIVEALRIVDWVQNEWK